MVSSTSAVARRRFVACFATSVCRTQQRGRQILWHCPSCRSFGGYGTVEKTLPGCLEGRFSELWPMRVLGQTSPTIAQRGTSAEAAAVRGAICGPVCLPVPRTTGVGSLLLPVRDATASLAHEVHATVLRDHDSHRSGQRSAQTVG